MIYVIGLAVILILMKFLKEDKDWLFLLITGVLLLAIMGLRTRTVGTDSNHYLEKYFIIFNDGAVSFFDDSPLFYWFIKFISKHFGYNQQLYFFSTGLFIILPVWIAIYLSKVPVRYSVLMYYLLFFQNSLNITRQYIAVAFVFLAYVLALKKKPVPVVISLILLVCAFFVHKVAIIGAAMVGLALFNLENKTIRRIFIGLISVACVSVNVLIEWFIKNSAHYQGSVHNVNDPVGASAMVFQLIPLGILIGAFYMILKNKDDTLLVKKADFDNITLVIFFEFALFLVGGRKWYIHRALFFPEMVITLIFPSMIKIEEGKLGKLFRLGIYTVAGFMFIYGIVRNLNDVRPYYFFWQQV